MVTRFFKNQSTVTSIFFVFLCLLFFYQIFLGKIPIPADLIVGGYFPWLDSKWGTITGVPVKNPLLTDAVSIIYPLRTFASQTLKTGQFPFWNPLMFAGYPLLASLPLGLYFPTFIFYLIFPSPLAWTLQVMTQVLLGLASMYLLMRHLKVDRLPSLFSSVAYAFGGFSLLWLEWNTQVAATSLLPLLILLEDKLILSKKLVWGVLLSACLTLQIFAGYLPVTIFSLFAALIWFLFRYSTKTGFKLVLFIALGISLSGVLLFPAIELFQHSQRMYEVVDFKEAFVPFQFIINLFVPDFFGNPATGNFWGEANYLNAALYTGIITFILALFGAITLYKKTVVKFAIVLFILTLVIITPNLVAELLYQLGIWGGPSIALNRADFLINFAVSLLAGLGLSKLSLQNTGKALKISLVLFLTLFVIAAAIFALKPIIPKLFISFKNMVIPITLVGTSFLLFLAWIKLRFSKQTLYLGLLTLTILELFRFGWKFNSFSPVSYLYPQTPLTDFLKQKKDARFVGELDALPANMWVPYNLRSLAGYDSVYPIDIAKLIAVINSGMLTSAPQTKHGVIHNLRSRLLDVAGVDYIVTLKKDKIKGININGQIKHELNIPRFKKVFDEGTGVVLENVAGLPRSFLTTKVIKLNKADTLEKLIDGNFPINQVSISQDIELNEEAASLTLPHYQQVANNHVRVQTEGSSTAMLVTLDTFYPGWKATIDSKPTPIHEVNYAFRGVVVPKGTHTVDFYYFPDSFKYGLVATFISALILTCIGFVERIKFSSKIFTR